jgi:hypothetical protein
VLFAQPGCVVAIAAGRRSDGHRGGRGIGVVVGALMLEVTEPQLADRANSPPIAADGPVVVRTQREFLDAIRQRVDRLDISRESIDRLCGLGEGYSSKLLSPSPMKRLGTGILFALTRCLGLNLQLVEVPEATAQIRAEVGTRKIRLARSTSFVVHFERSRRFMKKIGRKGGAHSRAYMPRRQASELGRRAALARWAKAKATPPTVGRSDDE